MTEVTETEVKEKKLVSYRVVITGSTKGIGRALAEAFLAAGDQVCVTSRSAEQVSAVLANLEASYEGRVCGVPCDVRLSGDVDTLRDFAGAEMGGVDIWINNAGSNGYSYDNLVETTPEILKEIIDTNVYGTLICSRAALTLMRAQAGGGHVFNMKGAGSDGNATKKFAAYGFSKAGMAQLAKSLAAELKGEPIGVHTLSPGLVWTELVQSGATEFGSVGRYFINAIAETPELVAADVVPKIRAFVAKPGAADTLGAIEFLTPDKLLQKLFTRVVKGETAGGSSDRWLDHRSTPPPPNALQTDIAKNAIV
eukprot:CAMPEP_0198197996 /NCGR_PEP_ID=MMETSP1445-20131203/1532_1 /TAXON_ID=36898 /ORGANISM="Pyramimonas sp., Strain CCMP2087" /LENGTH=309 /DNA_ID=CAMNT_0043867427 /DNA_START=428 /DNA_END=1358 /DNA_ORIENTATION=+